MIKNNLPAIHPIDFLTEALTEEIYHGLISDELIETIKHKGINKEISEYLGKVFNTSPQYWLNLQAAYDLKTKL
jgi:plasmid maintenance system antidote protein VapI